MTRSRNWLLPRFFWMVTLKSAPPVAKSFVKSLLMGQNTCCRSEITNSLNKQLWVKVFNTPLGDFFIFSGVAFWPRGDGKHFLTPEGEIIQLYAARNREAFSLSVSLSCWHYCWYFQHLNYGLDCTEENYRYKICPKLCRVFCPDRCKLRLTCTLIWQVGDSFLVWGRIC